MAVTIREANSKKDRKTFVRFANKLYKGNPYYCPTLDFDELNTLSDKNPAMEFCTFQLFLAYRGDECVGRICAMINPKANEAWKCKKVRFGWFDFIDDEEVCHALLDAAAAWGKKNGMDCLNGPVGFTDFDKEGLLIRGFDEVSPMICNYNHPYYQTHIESYGLAKEADWLEYQCTPPTEVPERWARVAKIAAERSKLHVVKVKNAKELVKRYPNLEYFHLLSDAYSILYNYQPPTEKQMQYIADMYFGLLNFDFVSLVENEKNEIVALGLGLPSLTRAFQHCPNGSLFPFGWSHLIKALKAKQVEVFEELLIAVRPDYQDKGALALIFVEQIPVYNKYGIKKVETGPILETNKKNAANFTYFEHRQHKQRRAYQKKIGD